MEIASRKDKLVLKAKAVYNDDDTAIRFFLDAAEASGFSESAPSTSSHWHDNRSYSPRISGKDSYGDEYELYFASGRKVSGIKAFLNDAEISSYGCGAKKSELLGLITANNPDGTFTTMHCMPSSYGSKNALEITLFSGRPNFYREEIKRVSGELKERLKKYGAEIEVLQ